MVRAQLLWCSFVLLGCGDGDVPPDRRDGSSVSCRAYQDAFCVAAERCGSSNQASDCRHRVGSLTCRSDELASTCAQRLAEDSCDVSPAAGCSLQEVADPAAALAACGQVRVTFCATQAECDDTPAGDCLAAPAIASLCDDVVVRTGALDQCLEDLEARPCETSELPAACDDAFLR